MNQNLSNDAGLACEDCGVLGAFAFEGAALCADCYQARGSSCAGGAADARSSIQQSTADDANSADDPN